MHQNADWEIETLSSPVPIKVIHYKLKLIKLKIFMQKTPPEPNF